MRLELGHKLLPDDAGLKSEIEKMIRLVVASSISVVNVQPDCIESIFIGDENEFGAAIHAIQKELGLALSYTNNAIYQAVGKTIAHHGNGKKSSSIVFRDNFMAEILGDLMGGKSLDNLGEDGQFCFYIFTHEVGHCKDNWLRVSDLDSSIANNGEFRIHQIAKYYIPIMLSELAACVHSSSAMTAQVFKREVIQWQKDVRTHIQETTNKWRSYQENNDLLKDLAFSAAQSFWVVTLQFAKLIGSQIGNPDLSSEAISWFRDSGPIPKILSEIEEAVKKIWLSYPAWTEDNAEPLLQLWHKLALANGYKFVHSPEGDAVYLDNSIIGRSA